MTRPRIPNPALITGCAAFWLLACSGRIASVLARHDLLPVVAGWLVWPRGPAVYLRGISAVLALVLLIWVTRRVVNPRWLAIPLTALGILAAVIAPTAPYPGASALFASMRPQLDRIATLDITTASHGVLPASLSAVAEGGFITTDGQGNVFVPQWAGIPDDAGGFWFTPGSTPEGRDMWGMTCEDPTRLDGDWWACGMSLTAT